LHTSLLSVKQALSKLLQDVVPVSTEEVPLTQSFARVLAQDIIASLNLPPFSNSAMDGFAVIASDVQDSSEQNPIRLQVIGDIAAGVGEIAPLHTGQSMRIMTGAVIPEGADAVVPVEFTDHPQALSEQRLPEFVVVVKSVNSGDYIRRAGQDVGIGSKVLSHGQRLRPQDLGMLAALGVSCPIVFRKPRVALISTGDELVGIDEELRPGTIRDSNGIALAAAVESSGAEPIKLGIVADDPQELKSRLDQCVEAKVDLILSSAGVSMGAFDFVRNVLENNGRLEFWRVNIRPGKPILKGDYKGVPIIGLPGNPVSALITFEIFVKSFIHRLSGVISATPLRAMATLTHPVESDGRESYLRAKLTQSEVDLTGSQDSGVLSSLLSANALIRIPAGVKFLKSGEMVEVLTLQNDSIL
jgi:molybdopterin molybdotransferase